MKHSIACASRSTARLSYHFAGLGLCVLLAVTNLLGQVDPPAPVPDSFRPAPNQPESILPQGGPAPAVQSFRNRKGTASKAPKTSASKPSTDANAGDSATNDAETSPANLEHLKAQLNRWDEKKAEIAAAVFRLGECYRKLNRFSDAKPQYMRILREFSGYPELVRQSEQRIAEIEAMQQPGATAANGHSSEKIGPIDRTYSLKPLEQTSRSRQTENEKRAVDARAKRIFIGNLQKQLVGVMNLLRSSDHPEALSREVIDDARYTSMKQALEAAMANGDAAESEKTNKEIEIRRKSIAEWIERIYLPELASTVDLYSLQMKELDNEEDRLNQELAESKRTDQEKRKLQVLKAAPSLGNTIGNLAPATGAPPVPTEEDFPRPTSPQPASTPSNKK